jgi:hypothetical protein
MLAGGGGGGGGGLLPGSWFVGELCKAKGGGWGESLEGGVKMKMKVKVRIGMR